MTPETAWAEAMRYENRANPFPFFDELRKTPVARVGDDLYVVTGYWELHKLLHDPRLSSDANRSPLLSGRSRAATASADVFEAYAPKHSFIATDPPDHDRMRRQAMRQFGPPHSPGLIPSMEPVIQRLCDDLLDNVNGKNRFDVVDDYAYPVPVSVICKILGVPLEDERMFHALIFDELAGVDFSPEAATDEGQARAAKGREANAELAQYLRELIDRYAREPGEGLISRLLHDDGPDGPMSPEEAAPNTALLLIAGHDSTVNTIAHCVLTALRNPGSLELAAQPPRTDPARHRGDTAAAVGGSVLSHPQRHQRHRGRWDCHPRRRGGHPVLRRRQPRPDPVRQPKPIRSRTQGQRAPRLGRRHPRLLWRSARSPGGQPRIRDLHPPRGESAARRRPAAVPAQPVLPRPAAPVDRLRRHQGLRPVKAFQFVEWQRPGELRDVPVPEPGPGQVLVRTRWRSGEIGDRPRSAHGPRVLGTFGTTRAFVSIWRRLDQRSSGLRHEGTVRALLAIS